jgi:hypothetical protein
MQSGKMFGLLIVAVEGLISVEPGVVTMGPDESNVATGPASAMVGGRRFLMMAIVHDPITATFQSSKEHPTDLSCSILE